MHDRGSLNRTYRLVFNEALGAVVAVPETARGRSRGGAARSSCAPATGLALRRLSVALAVALSAPAGWAQDAIVLPRGGQVAAGQARIVTGGSTLTVNQDSERAIINWNSFDISSGAAVTFKQPSASSVALNRVGGEQASQIFGTLQANGQVYLVNPAGILFGKTARVDVGGLVASALAMSDDDFLARRDRFGGAGTGSVVNEGRIKVAPGGRAVLLGRTVSNTGQISAPGGNVALAAGEQATLSVGADGHLQIAVDAAQVATLVANSGLIEADGGQVILTARGADALASSVVSNTGTIQARTVADRQGRILLLGDMEHGTVKVAGTLDASAPTGGNGGFIETSAAHVQVADGVRVTTYATAGQTGDWLIDPIDFTISSGSADRTGSGIGASTLSNLLSPASGGGTNVELLTTSPAGSSEPGDIHVNAPVTWDRNLLTLSAHRNININAVMTANGSARLALNYGGTGGDRFRPPVEGSNINVALSDSGFTGRVDFKGTGNTLSINGLSYTIIKSLGAPGSTTGADLQGMFGGSTRYALGADIVADETAGWNSGAGFQPISTFNGVFEGLGHTISNLTINRGTTSEVGLFKRVSGEIRNVGIVGGSIQGNTSVGSLAGFNSGRVTSSYSSAAVSGTQYVGGLIGQNFNANISDSHASGTVKGKMSVGGLLGASSNTAVARSYATGDVTGTSEGEGAGGLAGSVFGGTVIDSYATGHVTGASVVGGLVGDVMTDDSNRPAFITASFATGVVTASGSDVGGLAGRVDASTLDQVYATGNVSGVSNVGGLVGTSWFSGTIRNAYATGSVSGGGTGVGGLVGINVSGSTISNAYSTGPVAGSGGGLVGTNEGTIANSFWNIQTSGMAAGVGNGNTTGAAGKTTAQMNNLATFSTVWNIDDDGGTDRVWRIYDGQTTPLLRTFLTGLTVTPNASLSGKTYDGNIASGSVGYTRSDPAAAISGSSLTYATTGVNAGSYDTAAGTLRWSGLYSHQQGYDISFGNASLNIDRKLLGVNGLMAQNKTYDGNDIATVTFDRKAAGVVGTDDVSVASLTANFADRNAGTWDVTVTGGTLGGQQAGNYAIADLSGAGLRAKIDPKPITATIAAHNKTYDGTLDATTTGELTGHIGTDDLTFRTSGNFLDKNVGPGKSVIASYTFTGNDAGNYTLTITGDPPKANIDAKPITATITAHNKTYDGTLDATTTGELTGHIGTDDLTFRTSGNFLDKNVGPGKSVVASYTFTGNDAGNYTLTITGDPPKANIDAKPITATITAHNKTYDGTLDATTTGELTGHIGTDDLTFRTSGNFLDKNVGPGKSVIASYTFTGNDAGNYTLTVTGDPPKANIDAKPITATITAHNKTYDGTFDATTTGELTGNIATDDLTFRTSGNFLDKDVGQGKPVVASYTLTGNDVGNYTLTIPGDPPKANIDAKPITGSITAANKTYDGNTSATVSSAGLTGVINNDNVTLVLGTGEFADPNVGTKTVAAKDSRLTGDQAGNYKLSTDPTVTANIDAAPLLVTANDASHVANGLPFYGGNGVQYTGFVPGENVSVLGGSLTWGGTGQGAVQPGGYSLAVSGLAAPNYRIEYRDGLLTILAAAPVTPPAAPVTPPAAPVTPPAAPVTPPAAPVTPPTAPATSPIAAETIPASPEPTNARQIDRITQQALTQQQADTLRAARSQVPLTVVENYLRVD